MRAVPCRQARSRRWKYGCSSASGNRSASRRSRNAATAASASRGTMTISERASPRTGESTAPRFRRRCRRRSSADGRRPGIAMPVSHAPGRQHDVQQARDVGGVEKRALPAGAIFERDAAQVKPGDRACGQRGARRRAAAAPRAAATAAPRAIDQSAREPAQAPPSARAAGPALRSRARTSRSHVTMLSAQRSVACRAANGRRRGSTLAASATYTATFHASSASTGGASRLIRCAGPISTPAAPMTNAPTRWRARASRAPKERARAPRTFGCRFARRSTTSARDGRETHRPTRASPTISAAARPAHTRSASLQISRAPSVVSIARTSTTLRAVRSSMRRHRASDRSRRRIIHHADEPFHSSAILFARIRLRASRHVPRWSIISSFMTWPGAGRRATLLSHAEIRMKHHDPPAPPVKGRGATFNPANRFRADTREPYDDGWRRATRRRRRAAAATDDGHDPARANDHRAQRFAGHPVHAVDQSVPGLRAWLHLLLRAAVARVSRPVAGLDFETKLYAKPDAAELLRAELAKPGYRCEPIALGTNTDPYQPIEREWKVTRSVLEVLAEHRASVHDRHQVGAGRARHRHHRADGGASGWRASTCRSPRSTASLRGSSSRAPPRRTGGCRR